MPKTLLIMRHAKSSRDDPTVADHERPLDARGKREAELMGGALARRGLAPEQIISSTARRARATAKRVARALPAAPEMLEDKHLYDSRPELCLRVLAEKAQGDTVLLIGHNPTFEELVRALTGRYVALPTATVAIVSLTVHNWGDLGEDSRGRLEDVLSPREAYAVNGEPAAADAL